MVFRQFWTKGNKLVLMRNLQNTCREDIERISLRLWSRPQACSLGAAGEGEGPCCRRTTKAKAGACLSTSVCQSFLQVGQHLCEEPWQWCSVWQRDPPGRQTPESSLHLSPWDPQKKGLWAPVPVTRSWETENSGHFLVRQHRDELLFRRTQVIKPKTQYRNECTGKDTFYPGKE